MNALVDHKAFADAAPSVSLFGFKGHQIRVVMIGGEPWFVGRDACEPLFDIPPSENTGFPIGSKHLTTLRSFGFGQVTTTTATCSRD
jgi:hypothetical protein